jgi:hypothetical protein
VSDNNQHLPVVTITIVLNGAGFVIRDNGGDFQTKAFGFGEHEAQRQQARERVQREAERRMQHYTELGSPVRPWRVPA